jgi:hypothetical protein
MEHDNMKIEPMFAWYDFWVGLRYDKNNNIIYLFTLPMFGIKISL